MDLSGRGGDCRDGLIMESGGTSDKHGIMGSDGGGWSFSVDTSGSQDPSGPDTHVFERPGTIIGGRYRIDAPVAHGGMGVVYRATQLDLERTVAIKAMSSEDGSLLERFRREAIAMADLSHPAVVDVYDFVPVHTAEGGRLYLVMAFIEGQDLRSYTRALPNRRLPLPELVELFLPVVSALVELHHKGIIHRDLKPSNLMRTVRTDGRPYLRLVDFGIARRRVDPALTAAGAILGTPTYMAPETLVGEKETTLSDIYSLGATMYHLAVGKPPRKRGSPRHMIRRMMRHPLVLPKGLDSTPLGALLERMLVVGATDRPEAVEVLRCLEEIHRDYVASTIFERRDVDRAAPWTPTPWTESGPEDTGVITEVDVVPAEVESPPVGEAADGLARGDADPVVEADTRVDHDSLKRVALDRPVTGSVPLRAAADMAPPEPTVPLVPSLPEVAALDAGAGRQGLMRRATMALMVGAVLAGAVVLFCAWKLIATG